MKISSAPLHIPVGTFCGLRDPYYALTVRCFVGRMDEKRLRLRGWIYRLPDVDRTPKYCQMPQK